MTGITRSRRGVKHDGSSTQIGSDPAEVVKRDSTSSKTINAENKADSINNSDKKSMISTGAVTTDAYNLRRKSCRETTTKITSNLASKKPAKPENPVPLTSNKKRPCSPVRRSERIEKNGISSSPNTIKSNKNMTPSKKKRIDFNESKNKEADTVCDDTSKKKKLLRARNYVKSIFASEDNEFSDDEDAHLKDDAPTKDIGANLPLCTSELREGSDECNSSKEDKYCGKNSDYSSKEFDDGSCSRSRAVDIQRTEKNKHEEISSNSNHILSSSNSESKNEIEGTKSTDITHDTHKLEVDGSKMKEKPLFDVESLEKVTDSKILENEMTNVGHNSILTKSGSTNMYIAEISQADTASFLPIGNSNEDIQSTTCNKLERHCGGKNCKEKYHLSCLYPPLHDIPPGIWLCHICVKKKVELGVYSISQGIESIWDVKEEAEKGKVYMVKYAGLAHVHNQWVPESQLQPDAVDLIEKFNKRGKKGMTARWKQEWTEPQRILQKRYLTPKSIVGTEELLHCCSEYLVKWKCLGYDNATWELEKEPFLCTSSGKKLISDFENRIKEAKGTYNPSRVRIVLMSKKCSLHKLHRIPEDWPVGLDNSHLDTVNKLIECWLNSQNAFLNVDQERIIKSILFLSAIKPYTCQPVLVVSTVHSLSLWEAEFARLAPSVNVVVYTGKKDTRELIRSLEFYEDSGCIMFHVLLSHPNAIIEDFDALDSVGWELLIADDCQHPRVSNHLETFKKISTKFRLLLLSSQLKDNDAEYLNLLSFLESRGEENNSINPKYTVDGTMNTLAVLKKKLACYLIEHVPKSNFSKFDEYWVPVHLSNVQLELYCSTLVSNSVILQSSMKNDPVGALRDILISTRKCCDHPYLVSRSLQGFLTKHLPLGKYLDAGVRASSKLQLLDRFLHEIKKKELRALVLYQSIGSVRDSVGDILEDFLAQKFGSDSFERVVTGLQSSKKQAVLNKFNDKTNGRFVFLIESHACLPSIKLSSIDVVIIFDSDWNPLNDLKVLQKIQIDSQFEYINIFRLYVSRTIEEKVLIFTKQDTVLDSHIQGLSPSNSHLLLSWGANYLFSQLDEFHRHSGHEYSEECIDKCFFDESSSKFLDDVIVEMVNCLSSMAEENMSECLFLVRAHQKGASYSRNIKLAGEKDEMSSFDKDPSVFWSNILEKRCWNWKFITSEPSQRSRKKVQLYDSHLKAPEMENEARKKRKKLTNEATNDTNVLDDMDLSKPPQLISSTIPPALGSQVIKEPDGSVNHATSKLLSSSKSEDSAEEESKHNTQQGDLYLHLKPKLSELSDTLKFPDEVKNLANVLFEYIMNNHIVSRDPETILQAFVLSLCWRAASLLKHKVDHRECLALANKYLKYTCSEEEANSVYSKLRILKKKFSQLPASKHGIEPDSVGKQLSASGETNALEMKDISDEHRSSESKVGSTRRHVSKPNTLETQSSASREANYPQQIKEGFEDNGSSENNEVLAFRHKNVPKTSENHSEPRDVVVDHENTKKNPAVSESIEIPPSRHENEFLPIANHSSSLKESDSTSAGSRMINAASDQNVGHLKDMLLKKRIDLIDMVFSSRKNSLLRKQEEERSDFNVQRETERILMNKVHDVQIDLIHSVHIDHTIGDDKIRSLNLEFAKKMAAFDRHMLHEHKKLKIMQESAMKRENEIRGLWLEDARSGTLDESFDTLPFTETGFMFEKFKGLSELGNAYDLISSHIKTKDPDVLITGNNLNLSSTVPNEISTEMPKSIEPCADIPGSTSNSVTSSEEEATQPNRILDNIPGSSSDPVLSTVAGIEPIEQRKTCAEIPEITSDLLPSFVEAETIELNKKCAEIPKSTSDLITSSIEVESNMQNKMSNSNMGRTSDILPSIEAETTKLHKMVDGIPRSISDDLPSSIEKEFTEPNRKGGEIHGSTSVLIFDTVTTSVGPTEIPETDPNIDSGKTRTEILGSKTYYIPASFDEEKHIETNKSCAQTPGSVSDLACNDTTTISFDGPHGSLIEPQEIVVSNNTDGFPGVDISGAPSKTSENEIVAEKVTSSIAAVESIEPCENSTEILAPESITLTKENEIIASDSVIVVQEHVDPSSCPVENLGISKETEGLPSHIIIESSIKQTDASDEQTINEGEETVGGPEMRSTSVQIEEVLPSTMDPEMDNFTASSSMASVHVNCSLANAGTSQVELSVDDYPLDENSLINSHQPPLTVEGEHTADTISNRLNASVEKTNEAIQSILPLPLSSEAEVTDSLNLQKNLPVQQPAVNENLQADHSIDSSHPLEADPSQMPAQQLIAYDSLHVIQSNQLTSPSILLAPPPLEADLRSGLPAQQLIANDSLHVDQSNLPTSQPILLASPPLEVASRSGLSPQQLTANDSLHVNQSNQLTSQPILHPLHPLQIVGQSNSQGDQSNVLGIQSLQNLPSSSATLLPERTQTEGNTGTSVSREPENHGFQLIPVHSVIHPQALHPDPLQNELVRIHKQIEIRMKMYEDQKLKFKAEYEQEKENLRKKYEAILNENESGFTKDKEYLDTIYGKVLLNRILGEEFRSKFIEIKSASALFQGRPIGSPMPQIYQTQNPTRPTTPVPTPSPRPYSTPPAPRPFSMPPPQRPPLYSESFRAPSPMMSVPTRYSFQPLSSGPSISTPSTNPTIPNSRPSGSAAATTSPSTIPTIPSFRPPLGARASNPGEGEARTASPAPRAPAPHLHRFRPPTTSAPALAAPHLGRLDPRPPTLETSHVATALADAAHAPNMGSQRHDAVLNAKEAPAASAGNVVCLSDDE